MKKKLLFMLAGVLLATGIAKADTVQYNQNLVDETGLAVTTNYDLDLKARDIDLVSAVVTASSATLSNVSFNDGRAATATITINSLTDITTAYATNKITVLANTGLTSSQIRLGGIPITEGVDWNVKATKALTATDIARALNVKFAGIIASTAPVGQSVIYSTAVTAGIAANAYTYTGSVTTFTFTSATFTGGRDNATIQIADTILTANSSFGVGATTITTRDNLVTAINADSTLGAQVLAATTGVSSALTLTAKTIGTSGNYGITSSTPTAITPDGLAMRGGAASAITINSPSITATSHGLSTGLSVYFSTGSAFPLAPLAWGTTYYIIKVDANTLQLATSQANASAGTAITLTSSGTATTTHNYSLTVSAISGTPAYKWRVSNDNTYWVDASTRTNSTGLAVEQENLGGYTFGGASRAYDFGVLNYRYLRLAVTAPTTGAIWIKAAVVGKKRQ